MPSLSAKRISFLRPHLGPRRSSGRDAADDDDDAAAAPNSASPAPARLRAPPSSSPALPTVRRSIDISIAPRLSSAFRRARGPTSAPTSARARQAILPSDDLDTCVDASDLHDPPSPPSAARPSYDHRPPPPRSRRDPLHRLPQINFDPTLGRPSDLDGPRPSLESQESSESSGSSSEEEMTPEAPSPRSAQPPLQPTFDDPSPDATKLSLTRPSLQLGTSPSTPDAAGLLSYANETRIGRANWVRFPTILPGRPGSRRNSLPSVAGTPAAAAAAAASGNEGDYFSLLPVHSAGHGAAAARALNESGHAPSGGMPPPSPSMITVSRRFRNDDGAPQPAVDRRHHIASTLAAVGGGMAPINPVPSRQLAPGPTSDPASRRASCVSNALSLTPTPSRETGPGTVPGPASAPAPDSAAVSEPAQAPKPPAAAATTASGSPAVEASELPVTSASGPASSTCLNPRLTLRRGVSRSMVELKLPSAAVASDAHGSNQPIAENMSTSQLSSGESVHTTGDSSHANSTMEGSIHATSPEDEDEQASAAVPRSGSTANAASPKPRRKSMSAMDAAPPAYAAVTSYTHTILPREEEGQEPLPQYAARVHIEGYLARKMEFSAPGVQSRDRSWRRYYFVLHGTFLKVYKGDQSALVPRAVALQAFQPMSGNHVHPDPINEDESPASNTTANLSGVAATASHAAQSARGAFQRHSHHAIGHHDNADHTSANEAQRKAMSEPSGTLLASIQSGTYVNPHAAGGDPYGANLVKSYSLQRAESGLAADYIKRKNVVRVRLGGEQFLIQCVDQAHVVAWIEALQAATNVALDLDVRQMPKFITLPRRRRRRRGEERSQRERVLAAREAAQIAEAQRRSLSDMGRPAEAALIEPDVPATLHESAGEEDNPLVPTPRRSFHIPLGAGRRTEMGRMLSSGVNYRTSHDLPPTQKYNEV